MKLSVYVFEFRSPPAPLVKGGELGLFSSFENKVIEIVKFLSPPSQGGLGGIANT
jgi:hypothetical protein